MITRVTCAGCAVLPAVLEPVVLEPVVLEPVVLEPVVPEPVVPEPVVLEPVLPEAWQVGAATPSDRQDSPWLHCWSEVHELPEPPVLEPPVLEPPVAETVQSSVWSEPGGLFGEAVGQSVHAAADVWATSPLNLPAAQSVHAATDVAVALNLPAAQAATFEPSPV